MKRLVIVLMSVMALTCLLTVPAFSVGNDKLIVKDSTGTNTVFVVQDTGNTGVGTATPTAMLQVGTVVPPSIGTTWDVYSYNPSYGRFGIDSGNNNAGLEFLETHVRQWFMGSYLGKFSLYHTPTGTFRMTIDASGNVGIGTTTPAFPFQVGTNNTNGNGAYLSAGGVWTNGSSREYKENIQTLSAEKALETVKNLHPVTYDYKVDPSERHVGFIAEDVPDLVATTDRKHLSPMDIVAVLTKVVQEQNKTIAELSGKLNKLEAQVTRIKSRDMLSSADSLTTVGN